MTDWIEWNGGKCPVNPEMRVEVRLRDGEINSGRAETYDWGHHPTGHSHHQWDIVAYRVLSPPPPARPSGAELLAEAVRVLRPFVYDGFDDTQLECRVIDPGPLADIRAARAFLAKIETLSKEVAHV